jgi:hypothetical protein
MDTINIQYLLWSVNTGKIGQVTLSFENQMKGQELNGRGQTWGSIETCA